MPFHAEVIPIPELGGAYRVTLQGVLFDGHEVLPPVLGPGGVKGHYLRHPDTDYGVGDEHGAGGWYPVDDLVMLTFGCTFGFADFTFNEATERVFDGDGFPVPITQVTRPQPLRPHHTVPGVRLSYVAANGEEVTAELSIKELVKKVNAHVPFEHPVVEANAYTDYAADSEQPKWHQKTYGKLGDLWHRTPVNIQPTHAW